VDNNRTLIAVTDAKEPQSKIIKVVMNEGSTFIGLLKIVRTEELMRCIGIVNKAVINPVNSENNTALQHKRKC
jgi:hypothetical protein